jgi:hypothetical protein
MSLMLTDILSWKSIVAIGVVIGVVAAILDIGGWLRKFIRLLRRVRKTTQVTVSLHIDDVELRQQECDLLREYLELVQTQAQNVLGSFPGILHSLPLDSILITPRLGAKPEALLSQAAPHPKIDSARIDDPDLDRQLDNDKILPWPQLRSMETTSFR